MLAARAAGAEGVDAQVRRVQRDGLVLVGLGHHRHGAGAGVDAALRLGGGHALHAVASGFELERAVHTATGGARPGLALDAQHHFLVAADFALVGTHDLNLPAHGGGVARVHARQVAREQGGFVAARAGADFDEGVALVVGVFGQQQALQLVLQLHQFGLCGVDFLLRHLGHVGVFQHLPRAGQVGLTLLVAGVAARDLGDLGMLARNAAVLLHVRHDVFAREQEVEFLQALRVAFQLAAEKGFHQGV